MATLTQITQKTFQDQVIKNAKPVLVDFYAEWCGPCRAQTPILENLAGEYADRIDIVKVNVDQDADLSSRYNVRSIPTLILFKGGEAVNVQVGMSTVNQLKSVINGAL